MTFTPHPQFILLFIYPHNHFLLETFKPSNYLDQTTLLIFFEVQFFPPALASFCPWNYFVALLFLLITESFAISFLRREKFIWSSYLSLWRDTFERIHTIGIAVFHFGGQPKSLRLSIKISRHLGNLSVCKIETFAAVNPFHSPSWCIFHK